MESRVAQSTGLVGTGGAVIDTVLAQVLGAVGLLDNTAVLKSRNSLQVP